MNTTLFVPGLWTTGTGPAFEQITGCDILSLKGIHNMHDRMVTLLLRLADNPQYTALIAHSGACSVVAETVEGLGYTNVKTVLLLNPAPIAGVSFSLKDRLFWLMLKPRYALGMLRGQDIALDPEDASALLGYPAEHKFVMSLGADSGRFMWELTKRQWCRKSKVVFPAGIRVIVHRTIHDKMVGTTQAETIRLITAGTKQCLQSIDIRPESNHLTALLEFYQVVKMLDPDRRYVEGDVYFPV